jgi:hypothetical protein
MPVTNTSMLVQIRASLVELDICVKVNTNLQIFHYCVVKLSPHDTITTL